MKVESLLKNEGINIVRELNTKEISTIAKDISIKLCLAFPEHNLSRTSLYEAFSSIKMYLAILISSSDINFIYFTNLHDP